MFGTRKKLEALEARLSQVDVTIGSLEEQNRSLRKENNMLERRLEILTAQNEVERSYTRETRKEFLSILERLSQPSNPNAPGLTGVAQDDEPVFSDEQLKQFQQDKDEFLDVWNTLHGDVLPLG